MTYLIISAIVAAIGGGTFFAFRKKPVPVIEPEDDQLNIATLAGMR